MGGTMLATAPRKKVSGILERKILVILSEAKDLHRDTWIL
jgi:hypothetical protein